MNCNEGSVACSVTTIGPHESDGRVSGQYALSLLVADDDATPGVLREAGLVSVVQSGRERVYRLESELLGRVVCDWIGWFEHEPLVGRRGKTPPGLTGEVVRA